MKKSAQATTKTPAQQALDLAQRLSEAGTEWSSMHNAIFGIGGALIQLFPTKAERLEFSQSDEYREIQTLLENAPGRLRPEANGKVLVRLPKSMHAALLAEAEAEGATLNTLIVAKLAVQLAASVR